MSDWEDADDKPKVANNAKPAPAQSHQNDCGDWDDEPQYVSNKLVLVFSSELLITKIYRVFFLVVGKIGFIAAATTTTTTTS